MSPVGPILVVEPYFGGSHRAWAEGMAAHLDLPIELVTLPARWWKWRMRGAAVTMAEKCASLAQQPEAVVASDMVDLAAFRTFARPHLGDAPVAVYFHESQLTYPDSPQLRPDLHYAFTNWLSALAADRVFFNTSYHQDAFFEGVPRLLRHFPDHTHEHRIGEVRAKSQVLEVGVELDWAVPSGPSEGPVRIVWNHRWEHDKDPRSFFAACDRLSEEGHDFELVVCGENFRQEPEEFGIAADRHADRIVHMGYLPRADYRKALLDADVVVSTAQQEFFGVSIVEAGAAGCLPILPDRLSYPGLLPPDWHEVCLYPEGGLVDRLRWAVAQPDHVRDLGRDLAPSFQRYGWDTMAPRYQTALAALADV